MKSSLFKSVIFSTLMMSGLLSSIQVEAQKKVYLNSYSGTNIEKHIGQNVDVYMSRQIFNGWNTICLPFEVTADELNELFGEACKLETLNDVSVNDSEIILNFSDVKTEGIIPGRPYLIYYSGETKSIVVNLKNKSLTNVITPITINGVSFTGTDVHVDAQGHYGILAVNNKEAQFVAVDNTLSGFFSTRFYVDYIGGTSAKMITVHNQTATSIKNVSATTSANAEIYNINGQRINSTQKGVNIINGKKHLVR